MNCPNFNDERSIEEWQRRGGTKPPLSFPTLVTEGTKEFLELLWAGKLDFFRPWGDNDVYLWLIRGGFPWDYACELVWVENPLESNDPEIQQYLFERAKRNGFSDEFCCDYLGIKPRWFYYQRSPESLTRKRLYDKTRQRRLRAEKRNKTD